MTMCHHGEDPKEKHDESVVGMLGDIQARVRLCWMMMVEQVCACCMVAF